MTTERIAKAVPKGLLALMFVLGVGTAQAETVLCGMDLETSMPCGEGDANAIGILDLEVDGIPYDVEFRFDVAADTLTLPLTFDSNLKALAAAGAASDALNSLPTVETANQLVSPPADLASKSFYDVPFEFSPSSGWSVRSAEYFPVAGGWQPLMEVGAVPNLEFSSFALFTVVPEPRATLSIVAALATLGVIRRWRREESEGAA
jgi:hypothetical protein